MPAGLGLIAQASKPLARTSFGFRGLGFRGQSKVYSEAQKLEHGFRRIGARIPYTLA